LACEYDTFAGHAQQQHEPMQAKIVILHIRLSQQLLLQ
jgi:hypothetical protein